MQANPLLKHPQHTCRSQSAAPPRGPPSGGPPPCAAAICCSRPWGSPCSCRGTCRRRQGRGARRSEKGRQVQRGGAPAADIARSQTCTACTCRQRHPQGQARHVGSGSVQSHVAASRYTAQPAAPLHPHLWLHQDPGAKAAAGASRGRSARLRSGEPGDNARGEVRKAHTPPRVCSIVVGFPSKVAALMLNLEPPAAALRSSTPQTHRQPTSWGASGGRKPPSSSDGSSRPGTGQEKGRMGRDCQVVSAQDHSRLTGTQPAGGLAVGAARATQPPCNLHGAGTRQGIFPTLQLVGVTERSQKLVIIRSNKRALKAAHTNNSASPTLQVVVVAVAGRIRRHAQLHILRHEERMIPMWMLKGRWPL